MSGAEEERKRAARAEHGARLDGHRELKVCKPRTRSCPFSTESTYDLHTVSQG